MGDEGGDVRNYLINSGKMNDEYIKIDGGV